ncbi:MAG: ferritin-like domain-containing protein [Acidimicrobiales bacterium]
MHIDEGRPPRLSAEVDQLHHESMVAIAEPAPRHLARRAAVGGALLTVASMATPVGRLLATGLVPAAWADLIPEDAELAGFTAGIELAVVSVYELALESGRLSLPSDAIVSLFADHHREHAGALNEALGEDHAVTAPEPVFLQRFAPRMSTAEDEEAMLELAYTMEEVIAATYLFAIGEVGQAKTAGAMATILPVESQHATVLATILDKDQQTYLVDFLTTDEASRPADFPA